MEFLHIRDEDQEWDAADTDVMSYAKNLLAPVISDVTYIYRYNKCDGTNGITRNFETRETFLSSTDFKYK